MDNTALFRACVKAMKVRKKALGTRSQLGHGRAKPPDEHGSEARNVVSLVTALRDFLLSQREDYINASWLSTCASRLSESDRDRIDTHIETGMRDCRRLLDNLRRKMSMEPAHSSQRMAHLSAVLLITDAYLKDSPPEEDNLENRRKISSKPSKPALYIEGLYAENDNTSGENFDPSAHLTEEQRKQLMVENEVLLKKFQSQEDDVKRLETQVVEIGRLQALFTEKVMEQGSTVSHIGEMAVDSTENVKYGNDQLRQAMKRQADTRVYVLFFLLVLTLTLLFLDWYNP